MITHELAKGDDEEFALVITHPTTGAALDMRDYPDWEVWFAIGGSDFLLTRSLGELPDNVSHQDANAPDGSLRVVIPQAVSAAMADGSHRAYVKLRDSDDKESTVLDGDEYELKFIETPLSSK